MRRTLPPLLVTLLRKALDHLGLARPGLDWYRATRHTFASQWVLAGGSIEKLSKELGHYSVVMTERYVHLRPDLFEDDELSAIPLDLRAGDPTPRPIVGEMWAAGEGAQAAAP